MATTTNSSSSNLSSSTSLTNTGALTEIIETYVNQPWEQLPNDIKEVLGSNKQLFEKFVKEYSMERQLNYEQSPVQHFQNKNNYYLEMIDYLRNNLRLFPYQYSDIIINELSILPFQFYSEMVYTIMKNEKSYDILPNFTAADVNRLMGIGRNQYIDIMNKVRSKKWQWRFNKSILREQLPNQPIDTKIDYWWIVDLFPLPQQDFIKIYNTLSPDEILAIAQIKNEGKILACKIPYGDLLSIYRKGLIHFHVPIYSDDYIVIPPLKGFIMNRTPNDHFEKLLYDILVTLDERTSVKELSTILQVDEAMIKSAVSVCCRLGFAKKKLKKPKNINDQSEDQFRHSWQLAIDEYHSDLQVNDSSFTNEEMNDRVDQLKNTFLDETKKKRIGFLFDSSLTAYLMMGNLAEGLKTHAVTLFEVGKMQNEILDEFLSELDKVNPPLENEGEALKYYTHAITLRNTLRFLRYNKHFNLNNSDGGIDMIRCESLNNLDNGTKNRILEMNYSILITTAPISSKALNLPIYNLQNNNLSLQSTESQLVLQSQSRNVLYHFYGPPLPHVSSPWFKLFVFSSCQLGPTSILFVRGQRIRKLPNLFLNHNTINNQIDNNKVMLSGWDQEPYAVHTKILLQVLNESLLTSPFLLQLVDEHSHENNTFDVPFPFERNYFNINNNNNTINGKNIEKNEEENKEEKKNFVIDDENVMELIVDSVVNNDEDENVTNVDNNTTNLELTEDDLNQIENIMNKLNDKLHLDYSFGSVKMIKLNNNSKNSKNIILPLDLYFGIPLNSFEINNRVCDVIIRNNLFSEENLQKHTNNMNLMCKEFLLFIKRNNSLNNSLNDKNGSNDNKNDNEMDGLVDIIGSNGDVIYPSKTIYFNGTTIEDYRF